MTRTLNSIAACFGRVDWIRVLCKGMESTCWQRKLQVELPEFEDIRLEEEPAEGGYGEEGSEGYPGASAFFLFEHGGYSDNRSEK